VRKLGIVLGLFLMVPAVTPARADGVGDFYRGKTVTLIVGSAEGGSFDYFGRMSGPILKRLIPGNPTVIVQNMPGASFVRSTEYLYNVAPKDGTMLLIAQPYVVLNKLTNPQAKYKSEDFVWIGRVAPLSQVGFVMDTSGVRSFKEVLQKEVVIGAAGGTGPGMLVPTMLDRLLGAKLKIVRGYDSDSGLYIAVERREIQGLGSTSYSEVRNRGWFASGKAFPIYTIGLKRIPDLPDVPTIPELAPEGPKRTILTLFTNIPVIGYTIFGPPGMPEDRAEALRATFMTMMADPEFVAGVEKLHVELDPLPGAELQELVARTARAPAADVEALKEALKPLE
jgi:tripartite-type tricarboxylate transporter receptor subunit TctC